MTLSMAAFDHWPIPSVVLFISFKFDHSILQLCFLRCFLPWKAHVATRFGLLFNHCLGFLLWLLFILYIYIYSCRHMYLQVCCRNLALFFIFFCYTLCCSTYLWAFGNRRHGIIIFRSVLASENVVDYLSTWFRRLPFYLVRGSFDHWLLVCMDPLVST